MSTQGELLVKVASKFGNTSTKFYTPEDRINALNWARDTLGMFDFPELMRVGSLTYTTYTLFGKDTLKASEPTDMRRVVKMWDGINNTQLSYIAPNLFDTTPQGNVYTREYVSDVRYFFALPLTLTTVYLRYIKTIQLFTTTSNYSNEFDARYDDVIVDGAIGWLQVKGKNYEDQSAYYAQFYEKVSRMFQDLARQGGWDDNQRFGSYYESYSILDRGQPFVTSPA